MAEHIGEWHTLIVNDPAETDDVMELEHPATCPRIPAAEDGFYGESYGCSMADEVGNCDYENFVGSDGGPIAPGTYRARFTAWSSYSHSYGTEDWDSQVEIEPLETAEHATEQ